MYSMSSLVDLPELSSHSREGAGLERESEKPKANATKTKRGGRQGLSRVKSVGDGVLCQCWHR